MTTWRAKIAAVALVPIAGSLWTQIASATTGNVATDLVAPVVGIAATPTGQGYWEVASDGGIFAFGTAGYFGSMGGHPLNAPITGIAATPTGQGYWEVASDGGIFAFGTAGFYGSMGGHGLHAPIVGIAATKTGHGYWEVASDGGIFAFGTAGFSGSMGGHALDAPIVGIAATPTGKGYWEAASDGGIFAFGTATFTGSMGGRPLNAPIVGMAAGPSGGYWEVASDGGIFTFGPAPFGGSMGGQAAGAPVVGMTGDGGTGYWEAARDGAVYALGAAPAVGQLISPTPVPPSLAAEEQAIVTIANQQVGDTNPYAYGPSGTEWCAYFASWVWSQAGVPIPSTGPAAGIGTWALASGGAVLPPSATPAPGDAVLWVGAYTPNVWPDAAALNYPNIQHVNIVTQVLPGGGIVTVGGNEGGAVRQIGPYTAAGASAYFGQAIYGFVQPPG